MHARNDNSINHTHSLRKDIAEIKKTSKILMLISDLEDYKEVDFS